ncbi:MAG: hypothetical protein HY686_07565 [Chloroflexi bacterium]|nr:hypothetical protein [Chloroflexota bacterium]
MTIREVELLMPYAEATPGEGARLASRRATLSGATVGFINNDWLSLDITYDEFRRLLLSKFEVAEVVEKRKAKSKALPQEDLEDLVNRAGAVITGLGN